MTLALLAAVSLVKLTKLWSEFTSLDFILCSYSLLLHAIDVCIFATHVVWPITSSRFI